MIEQPISRRGVLQTMAGLGLSFAMPAMDLFAAQKRRTERPRSLITLWMAGGPSQLETWDPHPGTIIGGETKSIKTSRPGLEIASTLPRMAERMQHLSVIRSLVSKEGDHARGTYYVKTGYRPDQTLTHPSLGAIVTQELPDPAIEIPMHVSLGKSQFPARGGYLGDALDAFKVNDPGRRVQNMRANVNDKRQARRLDNLSVLSKSFKVGRTVPAADTLHQDMVEKALAMMSSEQLSAFRIDEEPQQVVDGYGNSQFGRGCLVARRLVETGVRSIEVTLGGFDSHINNHETHVARMQDLDPAFASLMDDLSERDLLDSTVVLCIGEFGRTPAINPASGRDHWPTGFSCVLGGGGLASGLVIGTTDPTGKKIKPTDPVEIPDLYATLLETLGIDSTKEVITPIGRPMFYTQGAAIKKLFA
jgi:hypothetical protein